MLCVVSVGYVQELSITIIVRLNFIVFDLTVPLGGIYEKEIILDTVIK